MEFGSNHPIYYADLDNNLLDFKESVNPLALPIITWNRMAHLVREKRRIAVLEETIKSVRIGYERAKKNDMPHFQRVYNAGLYVLIFEYDIAILKNDALFAIRAWKKNFVARQLAIILYEAANDLPELLGKEFRISLKALPLTDADWKAFNGIMKLISKFKNEHRDLLNVLRNFVGAHRDKDAGKQLEIIEKVDLLMMMELSGQFYDAMRELVPFLTKLTLLLADWRVILKHMPPKAYET